MVLQKKLTRDDLIRIEKSLEKTDQELVRLIADYGVQNITEWGDGHNVLHMIEMQRNLVERLAERKRLFKKGEA